MTPVWTFEVSGPDEGAYVTQLDVGERRVLRDVVDDVIDLLGGDDGPDPGASVVADQDGTQPEVNPLDGLRLGSSPVPPPQDPALLRLLPHGYRDDADVAAEFRRLTEVDVRTTKVANLRRLRAALSADASALVVTRAQAPQVAAALTDLRLVVSERLGIRSDEDADAIFSLVTRADAPAAADGAQAVQRFLATLYTLLGMLQESLVALMLDDLPDGPTGRR